MRRIVVIGARGFLGGAVVAALRAAERPVLGVSRRAGPNVDLKIALESLAEHLRTDDVVVNAAGVAIKDARSDVALIRDNLRIAQTVANACTVAGAALLHVSSADIWPVRVRAGAVEDAPVVPDTAYGLSKLAAERELIACRGLPYLVLRPTYVYGPGMQQGRVFAGLMRQAPTGAILLRGDPESATDYLHIDDLVRAVRVLIEHDTWDGTIFHVGSGALTTLVALTRTMLHAAGCHAVVRFEGVVAAPLQSGPVSIARLRALGFAPAITLAAGCAGYARAVAM